VAKRSAGLLLYRRGASGVEVFLVHPGGPYWEKKDLGAWTIPKGEYGDDEEALDAARREFKEETGFGETGFTAEGTFVELGTVRQAGGKIVSAWAVKGDCDATKLVSNTCEIEWPPRTGRLIEIPEVDRGAWFTIAEARKKMFEAQREFLVRLEGLL
jgi:predicted NUDIX family NTP pyrophosphohydrolase